MAGPPAYAHNYNEHAGSAGTSWGRGRLFPAAYSHGRTITGRSPNPPEGINRVGR